ncbi:MULTISPECIES: OprD family outer membrane porin [Pseudomonas]|uniref:OprD family outer membrane porin n=1 Tax=Pseudomonas TaxID=286 RepID=UPI001C7F704F|nr:MULTISPECIES: OprD family outer membrane porin [Pseudomonas]MDG9930643.1 OprD family porin [Pseudomonas sp. GD04042]MDH0481699.1 OprD family porin [Pseudomonas sp. GD04015]MDH0603071.1 OprD family porin [Pseudomonas sp. GD03869]MDH0895108.1 OprD family porin [Pseudomonas sp. GD03875]MDH1064868.1 OprD family porin [Pseudomonas sp. GD03985]
MQVMKWSALALAVTAGTTQLAFASAQSESKGFVEDSSLNLLLRNTYWNRDYNKGVYDRSTWAQGFITTFESGFTQGTVGVGVDGFGLLGLKLDGGQGDMFPGERKDWNDSVGQVGAAVKARISNTVIKYGDQMPSMPVLAYDDSRLLPQSFTGTLITSSEIEGLELNAGHFTAESPMASGARDDARLKSTDVIGGSYQFTDNLSASVYFSDVEDVYKKKYANINWTIPLAEEQALNFDLNYYKTKYEDDTTADGFFGNGLTGDDNTIWSLAGKYSVGSHAFILAYQQNSGDVGYAYDMGDGGSAIWVANSYYSDFNNADEKSVQASYELDFTGYGVPGLFWKTAYVYGYDIKVPGDSDAKEREFFNQVKYTIQSGAAKDLSFKARNSIYRTDNRFGTDLNEWRLFVEYPLEIL